MINGWVDFYMEFADKLLEFKSNRKELIKKLQKACDGAGVNFPKLEKDNVTVDIDPFTVIGMFNKHISYNNYVKFLDSLSVEFQIKAEVPDDYAGPRLIPLRAIYFDSENRGKDDINNLWSFFEAALKYADEASASARNDFIKLYDIVVQQRQVKWNLTMGLYWCRPYKYLSLDSTNRDYINETEMTSDFINTPPGGEEYLKIVDEMQNEISCSEEFEDFVDFTAKTWKWSRNGGGDDMGISDNQNMIAKNTILYGPPGTGKTYHTAYYSVAIIEKKSLDEIFEEDEAEVFDRFNAYKAEGRIEFTTFHQSYGYEEFIEGIKPVMLDDSNIGYEVQPGVFKSFCDKIVNYVSENSRADYGINSDPTVWKVSLFGSGNNPIRTDCMENGRIRVGFDAYGEEISDKTDFSIEGGKKVLEYFINEMAIGDIVVSCYDANHFDAIGTIIGEYEWHNELSTYKRVRSVKWLVKGIQGDIKSINNGTKFTLATVYRLNISAADILRFVDTFSDRSDDYFDDDRNYVYIIDEINRGNISKIFGESITLVEDNKRLGCAEECTVRLPYSKQFFGIPDNLYILGTMNTADRSIIALDTALRRRFNFIEIIPDPGLLDGLEVDGISISDMLETINRRISVLYDREHTIGHAYFMPLYDDDSLDNLADIFKNRIVPLLQEYFYDNYQKIRWVLGDNQKQNEQDQFILKHEINVQELFGDADLGDEVTYEINLEAFDNPDAYIGIYEN